MESLIWTVDRRRRYGLQDSAECALCGQEDEMVDQLLVSCIYARELWCRLLHPIGWERIAPAPGDAISSTVLFSWRNFWRNDIVALSLLFDN